MKTKEFIKRVEELGYKAHKRITQIDIVSDGFTVATVSTKRMYVINSFCFVDVEWKNQDKLFDLIVEYAKTPVEDREEDTKDKLLNEINRILNYVKDFDNKGLMEVLNGIEKLEDDLEIFANDFKYGLLEVEE